MAAPPRERGSFPTSCGGGDTTRRAQFASQRLQKIKHDEVKLLRLFHIRHMMGPQNRDSPGPADLLFEFIGEAMECDVILLADDQQCWHSNFVEPSPSGRIEGLVGCGVQRPDKGVLREVSMYLLASRGIFRRGNEGRIVHQTLYHITNFPPALAFLLCLFLHS